MAKDYFQSQEFIELLQSYEEQQKKGESVYLDADDFADIADYYLNIDHPEQSMKTIEEGLAMHPDDEVLLIVKSAAYVYQRKFDDAERVLKTLDDQNSDVQYQLAQIEYAKYHNSEEAEKIWRNWMELENGSNPSEELKREKGLTTLQGAYVARVVEESAAYKAGIREGDVITQIDNKVIKTGTDLQETIGRHRPGDSVTITYIRNGAMKTTTANLTNRQGGTGLIEKTDNNTSLAADCEPLTEKEQRQLGINFGIKIKNLKNGKLKSAGLQNGYIILKANNRTIRSAEDLQEVTQNALNSNQRDKVLFLTACTPQGKVRYYAIDLSEE